MVCLLEHRLLVWLVINILTDLLRFAIYVKLVKGRFDTHITTKTLEQ